MFSLSHMVAFTDKAKLLANIQDLSHPKTSVRYNALKAMRILNSNWSCYIQGPAMLVVDPKNETVV